jgi:hypothetical protein
MARDRAASSGSGARLLKTEIVNTRNYKDETFNKINIM